MRTHHFEASACVCKEEVSLCLGVGGIGGRLRKRARGRCSCFWSFGNMELIFINSQLEFCKWLQPFSMYDDTYYYSVKLSMQFLIHWASEMSDNSYLVIFTTVLLKCKENFPHNPLKRS